MAVNSYQPIFDANRASQQRNAQDQIAANKKVADDQNAKSPNSVAGAGNTFSQLGRIPGGIAQGAVKAAHAPFIAAEEIGDKFRLSLFNDKTHLQPMKDESRIFSNQANAANAKIEGWTNSWVPAPASGTAAFVAKASDALGEAAPAIAAAAATGGTSASSLLAGTTVSHAIGASNAFTTEMIEGSGSFANAAISGATEWAAEAVGGKLFNAAAGKIANAAGDIANPAGKAAGKAAAWVADAAGEGAEEVMSGTIQSALTGEQYTTQQALEEFALGAAVGGVVGAGFDVAKTLTSSAQAPNSVSEFGDIVATNKNVNPVSSGDIDAAPPPAVGSPSSATDTFDDSWAQAFKDSDVSVVLFNPGGMPTSNQNAFDAMLANNAGFDVSEFGVIPSVNSDPFGGGGLETESGTRTATATLDLNAYLNMISSQEADVAEASMLDALPDSSVIESAQVQVDSSPQAIMDTAVKPVEMATVNEQPSVLAPQAPSFETFETSDVNKSNMTIPAAPGVVPESTPDHTTITSPTPIEIPTKTPDKSSPAQSPVPVEPEITIPSETTINVPNVTEIPEVGKANEVTIGETSSTGDASVISPPLAKPSTSNFAFGDSSTMKSNMPTDSIQIGNRIADQEFAKSIWSPLSVSNRPDSISKTEQKNDKRTPNDFDLVKGSGATGRVYETDSYNRTFGGLSSY